MAELNKVDVSFSIAGKPYYIVELELHQRFNSHHTFQVVVDFEELDSKWMESPAKIIQLIGQDANIEMKHKDGSGINLFSGIVTNVSFVGRHGQQNHIRIEGCSPTIRLDGSPTMDSLMDKTLCAVVNEAVGNSGNGGSVTASPVFSGQLDYICQYEETTFQFLNRLSWLYGEWFFYDGLNCYFGKPGGSESDTVTYDIEMMEFGLSANMNPVKMNRYHYLVHDDKEIQKDAPDKVPGVSGYHSVALDRSASIYTSEANMPADGVVKSLKELEDITKAEKTRLVAEMLIMSGKTQTSKVKIGKEILVKLPPSMEVTKKEIGTFLVTEVTHRYTQKGEYENSFAGIPAGMENIPMAPVNIPKAFPQIATIKSNDDEKQLGRVKVELQWQKAKNKTTNWIRVKTEDAGKSDDVPQNRGFVFIPEKDDIIMIDFEYGDPNRPYVSGSIFSEKVSIGGGVDNYIKTIITRSGHTIKFDDTKGKEKIQIYDIKGNIVEVDTRADTINIFANKTINLEAVNIHMLAKNTCTITAGSSIVETTPGIVEISGATSASMNSKSIAISALSGVLVSGAKNIAMRSGTGSNFTMDSKGQGAFSAKKRVKVSSDNQINLDAKSKTTIVSKKTHVEGKSLATMKGPKVQIK